MIEWLIYWYWLNNYFIDIDWLNGEFITIDLEILINYLFVIDRLIILLLILF